MPATPFTDNLLAIAESNPHLAKRLTLPAKDKHLLTAADGTHIYKIRNRLFPLKLSPAEEKRILDNHLNVKNILLFGCGVGALAKAAFKRWPQARFTLWDRDPALLRLALTQEDFTQAISEGRLKVCLGSDLKNTLPLGPDVAVISHPIADAVYTLEKALLTQTPAGIPIAIGLGGLFVEDVANTLREMGYCPWPVVFRGWDEAEISHSLAVIGPAFALSINYTHGLSEFLESRDIPLIVWEIDPTTESIPTRSPPSVSTAIFTYRRANVSPYIAGGFTQSTHLPLAANVERRRPIQLSEIQREKFASPLSFVGSSMVGPARFHRQRFEKAYLDWRGLSEEAQRECDKKIGRVLLAQARAGQRYILPEAMQLVFPDFLRETRPIYHPVDPISWLAEVAAAQHRLRLAGRLAPYGLQLWGDDGWAALAGSGSQHRGYAGHNLELTCIYNGSDINIDMGRLYQQDIITMRVFDVMACGGFVIAQHTEDLAQLFELDVEVVAYQNQKELIKKIEYYQAHPEERLAIAKRGYEAVRKRHSIRNRVETMLAQL